MLEFIEHFVDEHRRSPLIREIQLECGIASYKSAVDRLNALERKGHIKRAPHKHRGIKLIRRRRSPEVVLARPPFESAGEPLA